MLVYAYILFFSVLITFAIIASVESKDLFNPLVIFVLPIATEVFLFSLKLSSYYTNTDLITLIFIFLIPLSFSLGYLSYAAMIPTRSKPATFLADNNISLRRLKFIIIIINLLALIVFFVESALVKPALISNSPTEAYMNFGLPVIHHFVNLLMLTLPLSVIYKRKTRKNFLFVFAFILSITIYTFIMARLQIIIVIFISFLSHYYITGIRKKTWIAFILVSLLFVGFIFPVLGVIRTNIDSSGNMQYFFDLAGMNPNKYSLGFAQIYMYSTISLKNLINVIENFKGTYFGTYSFVNFIPLLKPEYLFDIKLNDYREQVGLTTFMFGKSLYIDFKYFMHIPIFILGSISAYIYKKSRDNQIFFMLIYIVVLSRVLLISFFSDSLVGSNVVIYFVAIVLVCKYVSVK